MLKISGGRPGFRSLARMTLHVSSLWGDVRIQVMQSVAIPLSLSDVDHANDELSVKLLDGPNGMTLEDRHLIWTPTSGQGPAVYEVTVQVTDTGRNFKSTIDSFVVSVENSLYNHNPTIEPLQDVVVFEHTPLTLQLTGNEVDPGQSIAFSVDLTDVALAAMNVDSESGLLEWTPTEEDGGKDIEVTVRVTDNGPGELTASTSFQVQVHETNEVPDLRDIEHQYVNIGQLFAYQVNAVDADIPDQLLTYSLEGDMPDGMTISAKGLIEWFPDATHETRDYEIVVRVWDGQISATTGFTLTLAPPFAPQFILFEAPESSVSEGETVTLEAGFLNFADNNVAEVAFYQDADGDGVISHSDPIVGEVTSPNVDGLYTIDVDTSLLPTGSHAFYALSVDQYDQYSAATPLPIEVLAVGMQQNQPPVLIDPPDEVTVYAGDTLRHPWTALDPEGDEVVFALDFAPEGVSISPTGLLQWDTTEEMVGAEIAVLLRASDQQSPALSDLHYVIIQVLDPESPPVIAPIYPPAAVENSQFTLDVDAQSHLSMGESIEFSLGPGAPRGMYIDRWTGFIAWYADEEHGGQTFDVTVIASNAFNSSESTFSIFVEETNTPPEIVSSNASVAVVDQPWRYQIVTKDSDLPAQNVLVDSVEFPPEMSDAQFSPATGTIQWTPATDHAYQELEFSVLADDQAGGIALESVFLEVFPSEIPTLSLLPIADQIVNEGNLASFVAVDNTNIVGNHGDDHTFALEFTDVELRSATLDAYTGEFNWLAPEGTGGRTFEFDVVLTSSSGGVTRQPVAVSVQETNLAPELFPILSESAVAEQQFVLRANVLDSDLPAQTISFELLSPTSENATIDQRGVMQWTPPLSLAGNSVDFTVRAIDSWDAMADQQFSIDVVAPVSTTTSSARVDVDFIVDQPYENDRGIVPLNRGWEESGRDLAARKVVDLVYPGIALLPQPDPELRTLDAHFQNLEAEDVKGHWSLQLSGGDVDSLRIYDANGKEIPLDASGRSAAFAIVVPGLNALHVPFYLEGIIPADSLSLEFKFIHASDPTDIRTDSVELRVAGVDLKVGRIQEGDEVLHGAFVPTNRDFDQGFELVDQQFADNDPFFRNALELNNINDDELVAAKVKILRDGPTEGFWYLSIPDNLRIWDTRTRTRIESEQARIHDSSAADEIPILIDGLNVTRDAGQVIASFVPLAAQSDSTALLQHATRDKVLISVITSDLQLGSGIGPSNQLSEQSEESIRGVMAVNDDHDEGNVDPTRNNHPVSDNGNLTSPLPGGQLARREYRATGIIPTDDELVQSSVDLHGPLGEAGLWWIDTGIGNQRVKIWRQTINGMKLVPNQLTTAELVHFEDMPQTIPIWIEGYRPGSVTLTNHLAPRDATTRNSSGTNTSARDTAAVEVVNINVEIDRVDEWEESTTGAWVRLNNDFSKLQENRRLQKIPDNNLTDARELLFDTSFDTDLEELRLEVLHPTIQGDISLDFDETSVLVWMLTGNRTAERIPPNTAISLDGSSQRLSLLLEGLKQSTTLDQTLHIVFDTDPNYYLPLTPLSDSAKFSVVEFSMAVDGNRDGRISKHDYYDRRQTFWFNNDLESVYANDKRVETDAPTNGRFDAHDQTLFNRRDIEDFAPLRLHISPNLHENLNHVGVELDDAPRSTTVRIFDQYTRGFAHDSAAVHVASLDAANVQTRLQSHFEALVEGNSSIAGSALQPGANTLLLEASCGKPDYCDRVKNRLGVYRISQHA